MRQSNWLALIALAGAVMVLTQGCPGCAGGGDPSDAGVDAGVVDTAPDASEDAGVNLSCVADKYCAELNPQNVCDQVQTGENPTFGTCVAKCRIDDDCAHYDQGLRCEETSGHCIPARGCIDDSNCPPQQFDPKDYCNPSGLQCRCVTENNATDLPGVCRRRHAVCEECQFDEECGSGALFDPVGRCRALQGDPSGTLPDGGTRKYCFQQDPQCPCGMIRGVDGLCVPQTGSCEQPGCSADSDCKYGTVCNTVACLCEARCSWNFDRQELNPPGCPVDSPACWVDPANLDAGSPFFGTGRCRPPCDTDAECQQIDPRLVCKGETIAGGLSDKRCRPAGDCMDDFECPQPVEGATALGYCDRASFTCKNDCRTGTDPVTGQPYEDCISGYKCVNQNGTNVCKQQTCLELGGARLGCIAGQYCCGEDRNGDGVAEPCPSTGVDSNQCYPAPNPPFCATCASNEDCNQPGYNVNGSPLPALCVYGGDRPDGTAGVNICAPATFNDFSLDQNGVSAAYRGCPAKYGTQLIKIECTRNSDCDHAGVPGSGVCAGDPQQTLPDGGHPLVCLCQGTGNGTDSSGCPGDPDAGTGSYCKYAPQGATSQCLTSIVCVNSPGAAYRAPSEGGCGL